MSIIVTYKGSGIHGIKLFIWQDCLTLKDPLLHTITYILFSSLKHVQYSMVNYRYNVVLSVNNSFTAILLLHTFLFVFQAVACRPVDDV